MSGQPAASASLDVALAALDLGVDTDPTNGVRLDLDITRVLPLTRGCAYKILFGPNRIAGPRSEGQSGQLKRHGPEYQRSRTHKKVEVSLFVPGHRENMTLGTVKVRLEVGRHHRYHQCRRLRHARLRWRRGTAAVALHQTSGHSRSTHATAQPARANTHTSRGRYAVRRQRAVCRGGARRSDQYRQHIQFEPAAAADERGDGRNFVPVRSGTGKRFVVFARRRFDDLTSAFRRRTDLRYRLH